MRSLCGPAGLRVASRRQGRRRAPQCPTPFRVPKELRKEPHKTTRIAVKETAGLLCRHEAEVRVKMRELDLQESKQRAR
jgi:hypothetical protein